MAFIAPFTVSVVFHLTDKVVCERVRRNLPRLEREVPLMDGAGSISDRSESIQFSSSFADTPEDLVRLTAPPKKTRGGSRVLAVSDRLASPRDGGRYAATQLTSDLRQAFAAQRETFLV